ncbi:MAG TPA: PilZ domain-containing protein [Pyrinomonadaceae bacterium]
MPILRSQTALKVHQTTERRSVPRIKGPFPAVALDVAACKETLGVRTVVEDLSADGFYLRLAYPVQEREELLIITQISQAILILRGEVCRVEEQKDGTYGLAGRITRHQIFSSLTGDSQLERKILRS